MKIIECTQGSGDWMGLRCGRPTASRADCIITPGGKPVTGAKRESYMHELAAEAVTESVEMHFVTAAMERGTNLEPEARAWYELAADTAVQAVGFVTCDDGRWGCSPDGLVGAHGGIEIKCPERRQMVKCLLSDTPPKDYLPQVWMSLLTCERRWWDLIVYTDEPCLPNKRWRVERDESIMEVMRESLKSFCDELLKCVEKIQSQRM